MSKTRITKNNTKAIIDSMSSDRLAKAVMAGGFVLETAIKTSMAAASHSGRVYGGHRAPTRAKPPQ